MGWKFVHAKERSIVDNTVENRLDKCTKQAKGLDHSVGWSKSDKHDEQDGPTNQPKSIKLYIIN